ncbi:LysR family transcriptional regulator [Advenella faeciporci]|uniref:LysR family transcriptional regulator n=1 Tax=Advenella faeciporci TaxID=797535 RepID=A0A918JIZ6_9BURK|nr:LysR family transcriptional regulator [Advenella faeciporci]GGW82659.1 LysR family transcriptional regulator [Advenella faeciporci]
MDKLQCMEAFVRVAQSGSFIQAAEQLGVTRSVISTRIQQLEKFINAPLFHRSTRSVRLSDIGEKYYPECVELVSRFQQLADEMSHAKNDLHGRLRIYMAPGFALSYFSKLLSQFTAQYTDIELDIVVYDKIIDPISSGFDIVFQIFPSKGDSLIERKIFNVNRVMCASPAFIAKHGQPRQPNRLKQFDLGFYSGYPERNKLKFMINEKFQEFSIYARISSTSIHLLHDFALTDGGIVCLPTLVARESLLEKKLIPILVNYPMPNYSLRAVFPPNSRNLTKIRIMIDFLVQKINTLPEWDEQLIEKGYLSPIVKSFQ